MSRALAIGGARARLALCPAATIAACAVLLGVATPARATEAGAPAWHLNLEVSPTNLQPGAEGQLSVVASNVGDAPAIGSSSPVVIADTLPAGLRAIAITGASRGVPKPECVLATLRCTDTGTLNPYEQIEMTIRVKVEDPPGTTTTLDDEASIEGAGAGRSVSKRLAVDVSGTPTPFGVADYELEATNADGTADRQAASHPFQLTTTLVTDQTGLGAGREPAALPDDVRVDVPPGLIGNPTAAEQCSMTDFFALVDETNLCPPGSVVGVATVIVNEPALLHVISQSVPIFNLVPTQGEPARFGFEVVGKVPVVMDASVRTGGNYGVVVNVAEATQTAGLLSAQVSLWGVPSDARHDNARGWECVEGGAFSAQVKRSCPTTSQPSGAAFLTLPTSCAAEPLSSSVETDSWSNPGAFSSATFRWLSEAGEPVLLEGCSALGFTPSIGVASDTPRAASPTGLTVEIKVPPAGLLEPEGLAEADVRDSTVTLPGGVELSPSAANGLAACSEAQAGYTGYDSSSETNEFTPGPAACPNASKLGSVRIRTPLLAHELEGALYLASPAPNGEPGQNPFNSLVALYLVAEDPVSGVLVKLAGEGYVDETTGRVLTTFRDTPQLPFEDLELELLGGPRAAVTTPATCGSYSTEAAFTPWSGAAPVEVTSPAGELQVSEGAAGGACPESIPFSPGFVAQSTSTQAGAFTGFDLELSRPDGNQALRVVSMHLPQGVAALLSSVELCGAAQAAASACPAGSEIGEATAVAGLGPEPYVEHGGKVYITGPYGGAPFGLEIVTPAVAGPFNLGTVTVRSKLYVEPENASVEIVSDPLPTRLRGIPLQLGRVLVDVNRPRFEFNPTSCSPMRIEGTLTGSEGASAGVSSPFQVGGCQSLPFSPGFRAGAVGQGTKADGTTFKVTVTSGGVNANGVAQAGIAKVDLQLPKQLSSRLPTLQKACTEAAFAANPASCPEGSVIGAATIHTPVLRSALAGPAYLVSHGNAAFPDVEFVLQGEGIKLVLDGKTQIKGGITYSKFESTPDAPFTVFETVLPAGPHGVLTPNVAESKHFDLCGETLEMPTTIVAQNGAVIERDTRIAIEGCAAVKSARAKKLTNAQKLAKALAVCRRRYRHAESRRVRCERQARQRYPLHKAAHKGKRAHENARRDKHAARASGER
ncbi:MAG TPA: hypothetical protein VMB51_15640 [Solirubrobacteraceae bacterium]|nr:hypothetical protein [Solirubrobacteraceae bacterium]